MMAKHPAARRPRRRRCKVRHCRNPLTQPSGRGRPREFCSDACRKWYSEHRPRPKKHNDDWWTPAAMRPWILDSWPITLDASATRDSALVPLYLGPDRDEPELRDALAPDVDWRKLAGPGGAVYLCAPFTPPAKLEAFLAKAVATAESGTTVVGLVPASINTDWWIKYIQGRAEVLPIPGRVAFEGPHATGKAPRWGAAIVVWTPALQDWWANPADAPLLEVDHWPLRGTES